MYFSTFLSTLFISCLMKLSSTLSLKFLQYVNSIVDRFAFIIMITVTFEISPIYMYVYIRGVSDVGFSIFADTDADFAF